MKNSFYQKLPLMIILGEVIHIYIKQAEQQFSKINLRTGHSGSSFSCIRDHFFKAFICFYLGHLCLFFI